MSQIEIKRQSSAAATNFRTILQKQLNDVHSAGTYKNERIISSPQETVINIAGSSESVVNFCANNYLGMSVSNIVDIFSGKLFLTKMCWIFFCGFRIIKMWSITVRKYSQNMEAD